MFQVTFVNISSKGEKAANIDFVVNSGRKCYITKYM